MNATTDQALKPPSPPGPIRWLRDNLFSTWYNTLLTILASLFLYFVLSNLGRWMINEAIWDPVVKNFKLFSVGQYPTEELWRVGTIVLMVSFLFGISWRIWGGTVRTFALALAVFFGILTLLPLNMAIELRLWFAANPLLSLIGYRIGPIFHKRTAWVMIAWLLSFIISIILLSGFKGSKFLPQVPPNLWGGLLLTFLLALVGIVASFPIGVLLALGRQSKLPVLKTFCVLFIEIVRGVPLVTILFMASIILPLFLPEEIRIDRVLRAMLGMTLFAAAYMAENVRGGLQAIQVGQYEAAKAVGLNTLHIMGLIILPQALRLVIPAIVGQFIALFMDTTLAVIVGLLELLAVGRAVLESNVEWKLLNMEVYLFIAAVFWVFNYSMSYASRKLEASLGVGER